MSEKEGRKQFGRLKSLAESASGVINISGIAESRVAAVAGVILGERQAADVAGRAEGGQLKPAAPTAAGQTLVITASYGRAKRLAADLSFFVKLPVYLLPEEEPGLRRYDARSHDYLEQRLRALTALAKGQECVVVAEGAAAVRKTVPKELFSLHSIRLETGAEAEIEELKRRLSAMGYERAATVEARGQYSVRGGILDVFPMDADFPYRAEFFDTEVDSIRRFDPLTQRSLGNCREAAVYPAAQLVWSADCFAQAAHRIEKAYDEFAKRLPGEKRQTLSERKGVLTESIETRTNLQQLEQYIHYFYEETEFLWDYLAPAAVVMVDDPDRVAETLLLRETENAEDFKALLERGQAVPGDYNSFSGTVDFRQVYRRKTVFLFTPFQKQLKDVESLSAVLHMASKQPPVFNGRMDFLETELKRYAKLKYDICIVCSTLQREENLKDFLGRCGLEEKVRMERGSLTNGAEFPEEKLVILCERDIFVNTKQKKRRKETNGTPIKAFTDIQKGDYVVHENHGVGKFVGVEQLVVQDARRDYLKIKYAGEDLLYVPVEQMDLIQKYVGAEGIEPKVNKLSGAEWKKTKARAKAAIQDMAKELLAVSAARELEKGYAFSPDSLWQREFEDMFPYEETDDQLRCVRQIKKDMEREVAMDRLLCGDVGYGKTEVAARAVFKCVADGKQAAVLVPTTILANQHYYTFKERFEKFPFKVDMLCRFRNEKQQAATIDQVKKGAVDVLIGTHRMLSKDVEFKDLGLLVIDEEQRFGVQHKEKIKQLRKNVDVLTLSATPIPRTLHMSLLGIRDMSVIEEPPEERYPVQTYVMEQEDEMLREAIQREIDRDGQVYVVYNRVRGIQKIAARIRELVPEASVIVGHGQMNEGQLEDVMVEFVSHNYNVLVATTIIESGIDIPNVNTILILDADHFGLSQLYQLRGRVGRSNRMAYAYLMYQRNKSLSEQAEKRLRAIKEFTEFGAGFRIAMRDLEIRGAGNLLGTEQSGHLMMIGYELYCKLVEETVRELSGGVLQQEKEEAAIDIEVEAYIPDRYIEDEILKLQMYKQIASIQNEQDEQETVDELIDRFGDIPAPAMNLIRVARVKALAERAGISRVHQEQQKLVFTFGQAAALTPEKVAGLVQSYGNRVVIYGTAKPCVKYLPKNGKFLTEADEFLGKLCGNAI